MWCARGARVPHTIPIYPFSEQSEGILKLGVGVKQKTDLEPADLESISRHFVMVALCILLPFLGITYGYRLKRQAAPGTKQDARLALGQSLIVAGLFGLVWWVSSCGILGLVFMMVLKTINLVP